VEGTGKLLQIFIVPELVGENWFQKLDRSLKQIQGKSFEHTSFQNSDCFTDISCLISNDFPLSMRSNVLIS